MSRKVNHAEGGARAKPPEEGLPEQENSGGSGEEQTAPPVSGPDRGDAERTLEERNEQYLRLAADFENFKRRKAQEGEERSRYASEGAVRELLPVLDNLQRAMAHVPEGADRGLIDGLTMVVRDFESAFDRLGITAIATEGEPFDPAQHEAVMAEESEDVDREMVVQELQRGYRLHDRVLRPAIVKVVHPVADVPSGGSADE